MAGTRVYKEADGDLAVLQGKTVAMVGYGNQGRSQALNMRDSGVHVIVGNKDDDYKKRAEGDGFEAHDIDKAVAMADVVFLLVPDEVMASVFENQVRPSLKEGASLVFASGYNIAFGILQPPPGANVLMIAPRMIGVGVRETFLTKEGYFSFVHVHQDATGDARAILLALARAVGTLLKGAIDVTFKQEAALDLFNEQAFGPAFGRVLLASIYTLVDAGYPLEAVMVEMYMSGEMSYTYQKMAKIGLVKQTNYHSQTSQYGAMSRGIKFMNLGLQERFKKVLANIESGGFAKEWENPLSRLKFKVIKFFATKTRISSLEKKARESLGIPEVGIHEFEEAPTKEELARLESMREELAEFEQYFKEY